jgi:hypothetical protein
MKTIVLFQRRPDLSRDAFRDHYETQHAPLAVRHVQFRKYVRNHVIAPANAEFDTLSEFWPVDPAFAVKIATSPAGAILRADEAKFMKADRFRAAAEESLLAGPPRGIESGATRKYALMLSRPTDVSEREFSAVIAEWSGRLFAGNTLTRVTMDVVRPLPGGVFPADVIVSLWPNDRFDESGFLATSTAIGNAGILTLESHETPPEMLTAAH